MDYNLTLKKKEEEKSGGNRANYLSGGSKLKPHPHIHFEDNSI